MINWVLAVYFINLVCLAVNWAVYFRNCRLDAARLANKQAARIIDSSVNTLLIATDGSKASLEAITFAAHAIDLKKVENIEVLSVAESTSEISAARATEATKHAAETLEHAGVKAVSYTHLDVYKRQTYTSTIGAAALGFTLVTFLA